MGTSAVIHSVPGGMGCGMRLTWWCGYAEELIAAINKDIAIAGELLDGEEYSGFASDDLFPAAPSQAASE